MYTTQRSQNEYWYRIASLVYDAILPALIGVIHNDNADPSYTGLPRNDVDLYNVLNTQYKKKLDALLHKKKIIHQAEYDILLPLSGKTDSATFDISLAYVVIRNLLCLKTKIGWNIKTLYAKNPMEISIAAYVMRGKEIRNFLSHNRPNSIHQQVFEDQWKEGEDVINGLNYRACDLVALKVAPLDGAAIQRLDTRVKSNEAMLQRFEKRVETLEDKMPYLRKDIINLRQNNQENMEVINEAIENLQKEVPNIRTDICLLQQDLKKVQVDSLSMILGILHSNERHFLAKNESINSENQKIKNIRDEIWHLEMKGLNLSRDQLERIIIGIRNKFLQVPSGDTHNTSCQISQEIDSDLESAQESGLTGLSSDLGHFEDSYVDIGCEIANIECTSYVDISFEMVEIEGAGYVDISYETVEMEGSGYVDIGHEILEREDTGYVDISYEAIGVEGAGYVNIGSEMVDTQGTDSVDIGYARVEIEDNGNVDINYELVEIEGTDYVDISFEMVEIEENIYVDILYEMAEIEGTGYVDISYKILEIDGVG